jgi:hypothetical protein
MRWVPEGLSYITRMRVYDNVYSEAAIVDIRADGGNESGKTPYLRFVYVAGHRIGFEEGGG